jgi:hypothetical protein
MRTPFLFLLLFSMVFAPMLLVAADLPKDVNVDIDVDKGDSGPVWYKNPIVIGIGAVLLIAIIILASRGGGTTIVERR